MSFLIQASRHYFERAHTIQHDMDMRLCEADFDLAADLRETGQALDVLMGAQNNIDQIITVLDEVAELLARAAERLGFVGGSNPR